MNLSILQKRTREFYENQADEFNRTRQYVWPSTKKFLDSIDSSSNPKILEIGCGNGRNMSYRSELNIRGIDYSQKLVDIVNKKFDDNNKAIKANMTKLPFENNSFDYIMCIAVYHHLDDNDKRKKALLEMQRVCKPNGNIFLQVWAYEQPEDSRRKFVKGDNIVTWKKRDGSLCGERYYHVYEKGKLNNEINKHIPTWEILEDKYEVGNWILIINNNK